MEITKIFIAAQPDSFKHDISELESFFLRINNCYVSRGHYFTPILDNNAGSVATGNVEIADCALAFFLTRPGSELPDNYKTALTSYNRTGKPRIFTYVKTQCSVVSDQRSADEGNTGVPTRPSVPNSTLHPAPERRVTHSTNPAPTPTPTP